MLAGTSRPVSYAVSTSVLQPPGSAHWLGTNDLGQDVLTGLLLATPSTMGVALTASALSFATALVLAAVAALGKRFVSVAILRLVDILQVVPSTLVLLLLAAWVRPNFVGLVCLLSVISWHDDVRILRTLFLRELTRDNVQFARLMGGSWTYCLSRHMLPALKSPMSGIYIQNVCGAVMRTAGLGFLGLTDGRYVTWGSMMNDAMPYLYERAWLWLLLPPVVCMSLFLSLLMLAARAAGPSRIAP